MSEVTTPNPDHEVESATIVQLCPSAMPLVCGDHAVVCLALVEVRFADGSTRRDIFPWHGPYLGSGAGPDYLSLNVSGFDSLTTDGIYYGATLGDFARPTVGLLDPEVVERALEDARWSEAEKA